MEVKRFLKTYRLLVTYAGVVVVSALCLLLGIFPLGQRTVETFQALSRLEADVELLSKKSQILQSLDEATLRKDLTTLTDAVPTEKSIGTVFATIDGVSGISVTIDDFRLTRVGSIATESAKKLTADEAAIGASILPFSMSVTGQYAAVVQFLSDISSVRRMFNVRSVNLTFNPLGVSAQTSLDAYHYPLPTAIGALTQEVSPLSDEELSSLAKVSRLPLRSSYAFAVSTASAVPSGKEDPFSL